MSKNRTKLYNSVMALLLCLSMLLGSTWAWFTDSVTSTANIIRTGTLKVELYHTSAAYPTPTEVTDTTKDLFKVELWEPGVATYENFTINNAGSLWLQFKLGLNPLDVNYVVDGGYRLSQALKAGVVKGGVKDSNTDGTITREEAISQVTEWKALNLVLEQGALAPEGKSGTVTGTPVTDSTDYGIVIWWEPTANDNNWNVNNGKTTSDGNPLTIDLGVTLAATQFTAEADSFGPDYDTTAQFPKLELPVKVTVNVPSENDVTTQAVTMAAREMTATVPTGVKLVPGTQALTLSVTELAQTGSNITTDDSEDMVSLDVHVEGVADDNTTPIIVDLGPVMPKYLNMGNYSLYHVEDGTTVPMTLVNSVAELDAHNEFVYDTNTGNLTVAMATFSEVTVVAAKTEKNIWNGYYDYSWYTGKSSPYTIASADQLAGLSAIVGGMEPKNITANSAVPMEGEVPVQDSFKGKTVNLIASIDIGDLDSENDYVFYPIGYYNSEGTYEKSGTAITSAFKTFEGTFDGQGHTISNFYQNTWEMKGDHNWYDATEQHYRDGMGLFGKVYGGTVKNLTVSNFSSDGEIATTGVIAAYADYGATFENIAIFNCNPRVYNIGNGGIVGCVGWYANDAHNKPVTFKNITVDNSNKISALWGSWDVACGGIVGQYYPTSGQESKIDNAGVHFENCHVSAQIDVYNDVCANYQYYAYRYAGMIIGSIRENETKDGHVYPKMDGITAKGCTVNFGTWNDYYYCELVANSLASYTHDYQMSRLEEIKAINGTKITYIDGTTGTVPASGRANYVIVDYTKGHGTENATCYHFVDGEVWNHANAGKETVDGVEVLKEDKQHLYLEFNNLFTGYGWGVTSKGLTDFDGVENIEITVGEKGSVVKFAKADAAQSSYQAGATVTIGTLFKSTGADVPIDRNNVQVTITPAGESSTAGGTYTANTTDWTLGTLKFTGTGAATVTITDYYFCKPTTLTLNVLGADDKHDSAHTGWSSLVEAAITPKDGQEKNGTGDGAIYQYILLSGNYYLKDDIEIDHLINILGDVMICLNGHKITSKIDGRGGVFNILKNGMSGVEHNGGTRTAFEICDCSAGHTGAIIQKLEGQEISAVRTNHIQSNVDVTISGGTYSGFEVGAVRIENADSTLTMNGGTITDNTTKSCATTTGGYVGHGGVYTEGDFTMNGGTITGNSAEQYGGGVYAKGAFTMNDGTITGNTAQVRITVAEDGTKTYSGGYGGGVYTEGGFNMTGGTITGNSAKQYGGGVYTKGGFNMTGGTIQDNKAECTNNSGLGGGVYVSGGSFTMTGGTITKNSAEQYGGGVYASGINVTITGTADSPIQITGNSAGTDSIDGSGGGIYLTGENVTSQISQVNFAGNNSTHNGAAIRYAGGTGHTLSNCTITQNETNMGSVYVSHVSRNIALTVKDTAITENKGKTYTAGIVVNGGNHRETKVTIQGDTVMNKNGVDWMLGEETVNCDIYVTYNYSEGNNTGDYTGLYVLDGSFETGVRTGYTTNYKAVITGGKFGTEPNSLHIPTGYKAVDTGTGDYPWQVGPTSDGAEGDGTGTDTSDTSTETDVTP